jgi:hypothetical protein
VDGGAPDAITAAAASVNVCPDDDDDRAAPPDDDDRGDDDGAMRAGAPPPFEALDAGPAYVAVSPSAAAAMAEAATSASTFVGCCCCCCCCDAAAFSAKVSELAAPARRARERFRRHERQNREPPFSRRWPHTSRAKGLMRGCG